MMPRSAYEFYHECERMPESARLLKFTGSKSSQFTFESRGDGSHHTTTLYGFEFCPYCGKRLAERGE